jgi:catechol 2,3-dioxygenase-like lactoylglutathione lyase family enzyme
MLRPNFQFILYVADQNRSRNFYSTVLGISPVLDVPGMTEFELNTGLKLGLMPEKGIAKILDGKTPDPAAGNGIPRCELYLKSGNAAKFLERSIMAGAKLVSPLSDRDWGDKVAYVSDFDGHIIAFAETI